MPDHRNRREFQADAAMSQYLSALIPNLSEYAGTDPEISEELAILNSLIELKFIDPKDEGIVIMKTILNERRKAAFATSERTNEITKMGLMMPKDKREVNMSRSEASDRPE